MRIGGLPINITLQGYGNVVSPANGPDWTIRFQVQALFPKWCANDPIHIPA
jgi:hypothetical protein